MVISLSICSPLIDWGCCVLTNQTDLNQDNGSNKICCVSIMCVSTLLSDMKVVLLWLFVLLVVFHALLPVEFTVLFVAPWFSPPLPRQSLTVLTCGCLTLCVQSVLISLCLQWISVTISWLTNSSASIPLVDTLSCSLQVCSRISPWTEALCLQWLQGNMLTETRTMQQNLGYAFCDLCCKLRIKESNEWLLESGL